MQIEIPDSFAVPLGRVKNGEAKYGRIDVNRTMFTQAVIEHIWNYGERQLLNDAIADKEDDDGNALTDRELVAKARKRLQTLYDGNLRAIGSSADPVFKMMRKLARADITSQIAETPEYKAIKPAKGHDRTLAALRVRRKNTELTWSDAIELFMGLDGVADALRERAEVIVDNVKPKTVPASML